MTPGLVIAAPASGSGKTVTTLGLLRAFIHAGVDVAALKIGPDFIDPAFHAAASGRPSRNLDLWAMRDETCAAQIAATGDAELLIAEGVMGLFDGAADETASTADAAARFGWPVVLVVDVQGQAASAAALVEGFTHHRADVDLVGVIVNRVAGDRHREFVAQALNRSGIPCFGYIPRSDGLKLPSRHLGLVQAQEHDSLEKWLDVAGEEIGRAVDLVALRRAARPARVEIPATGGATLPGFGQRMTVARDEAFNFFYPHLAAGWQDEGCDITYFSPLADEVPAADADAILLPGGYPELHAGQLAKNWTFLDGLRDAAARDVPIYGECGGFMVLGEQLTDRDGETHEMAGLLPIQTSFAERRLNLGYREVRLIDVGLLGAAGQKFRGHEFHYSTFRDRGGAAPLFRAWDAAGNDLGTAGCRQGSVTGSYIHLVDTASAG